MARLVSSDIAAKRQIEYTMAKKTFRAKVTLNDDGTTVIEPYRKSGSPRYEYLLDVKYGFLRRTKKDYIVVFRFPRKAGILAAARHLISATSRLSILMCNLFFNHNES